MREYESRCVDRSVDALVQSAGTAVAFQALEMLGSCYGTRVAVLAGPGLNGADGRVAGAWLKYRGAHVDVIEVSTQPAVLRGFDLVIDAAFGVGCSRPYTAPSVSSSTLVLAVDVPSGVNADNGEFLGSPMKADVTWRFAAAKYAHVTGPSQAFVGRCALPISDWLTSFAMASSRTVTCGHWASRTKTITSGNTPSRCSPARSSCPARPNSLRAGRLRRGIDDSTAVP